MNSASVATADEALPVSERGPAPIFVVATYGFWLFLLSDIVIFGVLFAAYAVLAGQTAIGPGDRDLFDPPHVLIETACLLASSFTCGMATIFVQRGSARGTYGWSVATVSLGATFLALELSEFGDLMARGAGPSRSAFLSASFGLVGAHGLHVFLGLWWLVVMMLQIATLGLRPMVVLGANQ